MGAGLTAAAECKWRGQVRCSLPAGCLGADHTQPACLPAPLRLLHQPTYMPARGAGACTAAVLCWRQTYPSAHPSLPHGSTAGPPACCWSCSCTPHRTGRLITLNCSLRWMLPLPEGIRGIAGEKTARRRRPGALCCYWYPPARPACAAAACGHEAGAE